MPKKAFPLHGLLGLVLVALAWSLNWGLSGFRTHMLFFPLWLGYILSIDGLCLRQHGASLLQRSRWRFLWLFVLSIPAWWLFEAFNMRTRNWVYVGSHELEGFAYAFWASLNFSTVIPAVFVTAEWIGRSRTVARTSAALPKPSKRAFPASAFFVLGGAMLAALLAFPDFAYPFLWLSLFFLIDPLNARLARPSLLVQMVQGHWRAALVLAAAALICGFFWEMWNYCSDPKWVYRVPFLGFAKVFEMPILGYGGYIPFAWELYALYQLVRRPLGAPSLDWEGDRAGQDARRIV